MGMGTGYASAHGPSWGRTAGTVANDTMPRARARAWQALGRPGMAPALAQWAGPACLACPSRAGPYAAWSHTAM